MRLYRVAVIARNPKREELVTPSIEALVDTGVGVDVASRGTACRRGHQSLQEKGLRYSIWHGKMS